MIVAWRWSVGPKARLIPAWGNTPGTRQINLFPAPTARFLASRRWFRLRVHGDGSGFNWNLGRCPRLGWGRAVGADGVFAPDAGEGGLDLLLEAGDQFAVGGHQREAITNLKLRMINLLPLGGFLDG